MYPPGRSRLPVRMFSASINQVAVEPNSVVLVPIRPYTVAVDAAASHRLLACLVLHRARSRSFFEAARLGARHGGHAVV